MNVVLLPTENLFSHNIVSTSIFPVYEMRFFSSKFANSHYVLNLDQDTHVYTKNTLKMLTYLEVIHILNEKFYKKIKQFFLDN